MADRRCRRRRHQRRCRAVPVQAAPCRVRERHRRRPDHPARTRSADLRTKNASGDYGLHLTGDHWKVEDLTVAHASKGIVSDGSIGTVIDDVEVYDIGAEAVHFRTCSSDGVLRNSFIHDTGRRSAQYGEGVYVGSANSNGDKSQGTDAVTGESFGDNTERVLIEGKLFRNITAEGADLKEGTDSGTLRDNRFEAAGKSGQNSADSAVDAEGNNWLIDGNTVADTDAPWDDDGVARPSEFLDVYDGYGVGNVFARNTVEGAIRGSASACMSRTAARSAATTRPTGSRLWLGRGSIEAKHVRLTELRNGILSQNH